MLIMGCDLHTRSQEIALLDTATGQAVTRRFVQKQVATACFLCCGLLRVPQAGADLLRSARLDAASCMRDIAVPAFSIRRFKHQFALTGRAQVPAQTRPAGKLVH